MHTFPSLRAFLLLVFALLAASCATVAPKAPPAVVHALAPTGTLRIAVYAGSPTSLVRDPGKSEARGVAVDLGRALARALGVPPDVVEFGNNADALAAVKAGNADFAFTNATPVRAAEMDFSQALLVIEQGYLVRAGSTLDNAAAVDRAGVKIGVSRGSTSERELAGQIRSATVVPVGSLKDAAARLADGSLDAFATNKAILHELSDKVPGARIVPGAYGREQLAIAVPKGRSNALPWLREFVDQAVADGDVARAVERAGLRGTAPATAEVRVMISAGFYPVYSELVKVFEQRTGHKLVTTRGPSLGNSPEAIPNRLKAGEAADVVIGVGASLDELARQGLLRADTKVDFARSQIGMVVRAGARKPDIGSVDAFRAALLDAKSIAYSDSASGIYLSTTLFARLGVADKVSAKSKAIKGPPSGEPVAAVVARGEAEIGFQQVSELLHEPGVDFVGTIPAELQQDTRFSGALTTRAKESDAALALIRFLASAQAAGAITKAGLAPMAQP